MRARIANSVLCGLSMTVLLSFLAWPGAAQAMSGNCYIPPLEGSLIATIESPRSKTVSNISVAGQDGVTGAVRVDIAHEAERLYLLLSSREPVIWHLTGDVARVKRVVLAGVSLPRGIAAGVTGIEKDKVTFINRYDCMQNGGLIEMLKYSGKLRGEKSSGSADLFLSKIPVKTGVPLYNGSFVTARVSSSGVVLDGPAKTGDKPPAPQGVDPLMWTTFLFFTPGGVENLRDVTVVSDIPAEPYIVLPGWAGLVQLVMQGAILAEPKRPADQSQTVGGSPQAWTHYAHNMRFRIVKDIGWFPGGLTGGTAPEMTLAKGVPMPQGDLGHVRLVLEETGQPVERVKKKVTPEDIAEMKRKNDLPRPVEKGPPLPAPVTDAVRAAMAAYPGGVISAALAHTAAAPALAGPAAGSGTERLAGWGSNKSHAVYGDPRVVGEEVKSPIWLDALEKELGGAGAIKKILLGDIIPCALKQDGSVWCWATEMFNCRGDVTANQCPPDVKGADLRLIKVEGLPPIQDIFDKRSDNCGRDATGKIWCWRAGLLPWQYEPTWVKAWPENPDFALLASRITTFVFGGGKEECGITGAGTLWCWGELYSNARYASDPQIPAYPVPIPLPLPVQEVSIGYKHCAILQDRTAWCWLPSGKPEPEPLFTGSVKVKQVQAEGYICAIRSHDGTVWCVAAHPGLSDYSFSAVETPEGEPLRDMTMISERKGSCGLDKQNRAWCWRPGRDRNGEKRMVAEQPRMPGTNRPMSNIRQLVTGTNKFAAILRHGAAGTDSAEVASAPVQPAASGLDGIPIATVQPEGSIDWQKPCPSAATDGKALLRYFPVVVRGSFLKDGSFKQTDIYKGFRNRPHLFDAGEVAAKVAPDAGEVIVVGVFDGTRVRLNACAMVVRLADAGKYPGIVSLLSEAAVYKNLAALQQTQDPPPIPAQVPVASEWSGGDRLQPLDTSEWSDAYVKKAETVRMARDYLHLLELATASIQGYLAHSWNAAPANGQSSLIQAALRPQTTLPASCGQNAALLRNYLPAALLPAFSTASVFDVSAGKISGSGGEKPGYGLAMPLKDLVYALVQAGDYRAALYLLQCKVDAPEFALHLAKALRMPGLPGDLPRAPLRLVDADISGLSLPRLNAERQKWARVNAAEADLTGANFASATLDSVDLTGAKLDFAFYNCRTTFASGFDPVGRHMVAVPDHQCNKERVGGNLDGVSIAGTCKNACPETVALKGRGIENVTARNAALGTISCMRCGIRTSDFSNSVLTLRVERGTISDTSFAGAKLGMSIIKDTKLSGVDFTGADLAKVLFNNCSYDDRTRWPQGFDPDAAGLDRKAEIK